jgi:hypothetical protein
LTSARGYNGFTFHPRSIPKRLQVYLAQPSVKLKYLRYLSKIELSITWNILPFFEKTSSQKISESDL